MPKKFLYTLVKEQIKSIIKQNIGVPNYMLPSENRLALKYKISRSCVRKALYELEQEGVIYTLKGKGSFINSNISVAQVTSSNSTPKLIAVLMRECGTRFAAGIIKGIRAFLSQHDYEIVLLPSNLMHEKEELNILHAKKLGCDGVLLLPSSYDKVGDELLSLKVLDIPCVLLDKKIKDIPYPCVSSNHYEMGYNAAKYLSMIGRKKLCYAFNSSNNISQRLKGYRDAISKEVFSGISYDIEVNPFDDDYELMTNEFCRFFKENNIDGIVCTSGARAFCAIKAMNMLGNTIFEDYDLVVTDEELSLVNMILPKPVPSIVQDSYGIGFTAAKILTRKIINNIEPCDTIIPLKKNL